MPKPIKKSGSITVKVYQRQEAMTVDDAMELIGWTVVEKGGLLRDTTGQNIALEHNATNRPFRPGLSKRYLSEILRGEWYLNGETIIFDADGKCQSGQHRLVAFIMAVETWKLQKAKWVKYHKKEPTLECLIVRGISTDDKVVNSIDLGQKRTLGDIIYRSELFGDGVSLGGSMEGASATRSKDATNVIKLPDLGMKQRQRLSNILAGSARLTWLRATNKQVSDAPHFPPSEAMNFIDDHPGLLYSVAFINLLEGGDKQDGSKVSRFISLGYAAGLFYLMSASGTDPDEWLEKGAGALDFKMQKKAQEFWTKLATGTELKAADPVYILRELLPKINAGSAVGRDEIVTTVIKAFNAYADGGKVTTKDLVVKKRIDENGLEKIVEMTRLGGIDVEGPEVATKPEEIDTQETSDDREGERTSKGKWSEGDTCWVKSPDKDHWFGTIVEVVKKEKGAGQDTAVIEDDSGKQWEETLGRLSLKYPA